jgi:hypothetical protein
MTPFENYVLDSERRNAFNHSQQKSKPAEILVYVEGFSDVGFWHGILSPYEKQNNIKFDLSPLANNDKFKNCFLFKKIEDDIQIYLNKFKVVENNV